MTSPTRTSAFAYPGARQAYPSSRPTGPIKVNGTVRYHRRAARSFAPVANLVEVQTRRQWADSAIVGAQEISAVAGLLTPRRTIRHLPNARLKPTNLLKLRVKSIAEPRQDRGVLDQRESRTQPARRRRPAVPTSPLRPSAINTTEPLFGDLPPARILSRRLLRKLPSLSRDGGVSVAYWAQWAVASRRRRRIGAALATMLGVWLCWGPIATASVDTLNSAAARIEPRAAFQVAEDFKSGVSAEWYPRGLVEDESGLARVEGLALHRDTMNLDGYRWDFDAKITSQALGWIVRASDTKNYYAYKLVQWHEAKLPDGYRLVRYPVVNGRANTSQAVERDLEVEWREGEFNRVSVRVGPREIKTFINGWSADYWLVPNLKPGGIGFLADQGEASLIGSVLVDSNSDLWGLTLYGALETIKSLENLLSP